MDSINDRFDMRIGLGAEMVKALRYMDYKMARKVFPAEHLAESYPQAESFERMYRAEQAERTCECGATIASDELTCKPCRIEDNAEADSERERLFGRDK